MGTSEWDFSEQLALYGPDAASPSFKLAGHDQGTRCASDDLVQPAEEYCRWVAQTHYENFQIASRLLPRPLRRDFHNIYAYCRWSDDLGDEVGDPSQAVALLQWWQEQLDQLFSGGPNQHPVMVALSGTLQRHTLPKQPFEDLLSAFRQDQRTFRYDSLEELEDYCRRSANPVGRLVLGLAGVADDAEKLRLSDSICTGLQLANFCQDVQRDAAIGRIYVPRSLWQKHSITEAQWLSGQSSPELQACLREFVEIAKNYLDQGGGLIHRVPRWLALDVRLFRAGGLAILRQIQRANYDVWTRRPEVGRLYKLRLLTSALLKHLAS